MDPLFDQNFVPRILITVIALAISVGPMIADFNRTHATNPLWTPHARFHVVWQVLSQAGISAIVLFLLWTKSADYFMHIWIAAALTYVWIASFYATLASMPLFEGSLKDVNGIKPFRFNVFGTIYMVDTNLFGATILMIVNTTAMFLITG
jgi:Family of unknown function (DUF6640)